MLTDFHSHDLHDIVYDRCNISPEAPPSSQIPPGTLFEMKSGDMIKVLEHKTPPAISNRNEGGRIIIRFDETFEVADLDLLKFQLAVVRKTGFQTIEEVDKGSNHSVEDSASILPSLEAAAGVTTSVSCSSTLEWPGRGRSISQGRIQNDLSSICTDEQYSICRGLYLRRQYQRSTCLEQTFANTGNSRMVDDPGDVRAGCKNAGMWDPGNAFNHLSWDPYSTLLCEICNVDKDDNQGRST